MSSNYCNCTTILNRYHPVFIRYSKPMLYLMKGLIQILAKLYLYPLQEIYALRIAKAGVPSAKDLRNGTHISSKPLMI